MAWRGIFRFLIVGFLALLLWVALIAIMNTVTERSQRREEVYQEMSQTTAGSQVLVGPVLAFPYEVHAKTTISDQTGIRRDQVETYIKVKFVVPKQLSIDGRMEVEKRFRSLYEILLYGSQLKLKGQFDFSEPRNIIVPEGSTVRWLQPYVLVMVQDSRGLTSMPIVNLNGNNFPIKAGISHVHGGLPGGFHVDLPKEWESGGAFNFDIDLYLGGMQSLSWVPVGEESKVSLSGNWPHPSFQGRALPKTHKITPEGFAAEWNATHFSSNVSKILADPLQDGALRKEAIGFRLIQPVDIYAQTERSVKYGFLFIVLTFGAFMLFEILKQLPIHPVQYALVGLALVLFYVLLLALSEHIPFLAAYTVASAASVGLLAYYLRFVLQSWKGAFVFASAQAILYAVIYGILISEDYALLSGACLLFALLATAMVATRRVDWNALAKLREV